MNISYPEGSFPPDSMPRQPPRTSIAALVGLVLGLLALPLNLFAGLPALLVSYRSLYTINASEGQLRGRGLAIVGMVLGGVGCLWGVVFWLLLGFHILQDYNALAD